jgi:deoxyribonuclease-4
MLNLGVHTSIAGGIALAPARARALGCDTMQIFARNPRQWRKTSLSDEDINAFKVAVKKEKISPAVIHIPYMLNLAAAKEKFYDITLREFALDLAEANKLGAQYLVTHPGSHKGLSEEEGSAKVIHALEFVLDEVPDTITKILLENTAGSGDWLGVHFKQIGQIIKGVGSPKRLGLCLDTAHAFGAGYDISKPKGFDAMLDEIDEELGLERLYVIHLNDTKVALGANVDRHEHIGEGNIGKDGFEYIINHKALKNVSFIMETPKKSDDDDLRNIKLVRKLYTA